MRSNQIYQLSSETAKVNNILTITTRHDGCKDGIFWNFGRGKAAESLPINTLPTVMVSGLNASGLVPGLHYPAHCPSHVGGGILTFLTFQ